MWSISCFIGFYGSLLYLILRFLDLFFDLINTLFSFFSFITRFLIWFIVGLLL